MEQFIIYDNNSSAPLLDVLWPYVEAGVVEYSYFKGWHTRAKPGFAETPQYWAYEDCGARWACLGPLGSSWPLGSLAAQMARGITHGASDAHHFSAPCSLLPPRRYQSRHQWLAYLDVDEFLVLRPEPAAAAAEAGTTQQRPLQVPSLPAFLRQFEAYSGVVVNWRMFGSSGHVRRPQQPVTEAYTRAYPWHHPEQRHVKPIARSGRASISAANPHLLQLLPDPAGSQPVVDVLGRMVSSALTEKAAPRDARLVLHHYAVKSREDFQKKVQRRSPDGHGKGGWGRGHHVPCVCCAG